MNKVHQLIDELATYGETSTPDYYLYEDTVVIPDVSSKGIKQGLKLLETRVETQAKFRITEEGLEVTPYIPVDHLEKFDTPKLGTHAFVFDDYQESYSMKRSYERSSNPLGMVVVVNQRATKLYTLYSGGNLKLERPYTIN